MRRKHGFTLIEILIVLAILGVLAAVLIPTFSGFREKSAKAACDAQAAALERGMLAQMALNGGPYPDAAAAMAALQELVQTQYGLTVSEGRLEGFCPSGGVFTFTFESSSDYSAVCSLHGASESSLTNAVGCAQQLLPGWLSAGGRDGREFIKAYFTANGNKLDKVDESLLTQAFGNSRLRTKDLYWRPNLITVNGSRNEYMMFAGEGNNNTQAAWSGYLVSYNGKMFRSTSSNIWQGITGSGVATGNRNFASADDVCQWLLANGFSEVS